MLMKIMIDFCITRFTAWHDTTSYVKWGKRCACPVLVKIPPSMFRLLIPPTLQMMAVELSNLYRPDQGQAKQSCWITTWKLMFFQTKSDTLNTSNPNLLPFGNVECGLRNRNQVDLTINTNRHVEIISPLEEWRFTNTTWSNFWGCGADRKSNGSLRQ